VPHSSISTDHVRVVEANEWMTKFNLNAPAMRAYSGALVTWCVCLSAAYPQ